jgi:hypothetical protein
MLTRAELTKWTNALRANPEQQLIGSLTNRDATKFCCLGKMCEVFEVPRWIDSQGNTAGFVDINSAGVEYPTNGLLPEELAKKFGDSAGIFGAFLMPEMKTVSGHVYSSAATANDAGMSWLEIADHFDKYYPCSDE